jgi:hypothetical protein
MQALLMTVELFSSNYNRNTVIGGLTCLTWEKGYNGRPNN